MTLIFDRPKMTLIFDILGGRPWWSVVICGRPWSSVGVRGHLWASVVVRGRGGRFVGPQSLTW